MIDISQKVVSIVSYTSETQNSLLTQGVSLLSLLAVNIEESICKFKVNLKG